MGIGKALRGRLERRGPTLSLPGAGVIDSRPRLAVYRIVVEAPGIGVAGIAKAVGKGETSVRWHLRKLEASGLVSVRKHRQGRGGSSQAVVPTGVYAETTLELLMLINGPYAPLLAAMSGAPGATTAELAKAAGTTASSTADALAWLDSEGHSRSVRDGRAARHFISDSLLRARSMLRGEARGARDRLVAILQSEVPGLRSVSKRGSRVTAECPWGVEVFDIGFE